MEKQTSIGTIVYRKEKDNLFYLLLEYKKGHWGFIKGRQEQGETETQTATRESQEETGLTDLKFDANYRESVNFFFRAERQLINKTVVYFFAQTKTKNVTLSSEHTGFAWKSYDEAIKTLTFDNEKKLLAKAHDILTKKGKRK